MCRSTATWIDLLWHMHKEYIRGTLRRHASATKGLLDAGLPQGEEVVGKNLGNLAVDLPCLSTKSAGLN